MNLPIHLKTQIADAARAAFPKEACGLVVDDCIIMQALNLADDPEQNFILDSTAWISAGLLGERVTCIWHSHSNGNDSFSPQDIRSCQALSIPWYLFSLPDGKEVYYDPCAIAPYIGREWHYGISDCYTLMRDYYKQELGINLDDFDRGEPFDWLQPGWDKFRLNFPRQGFQQLSDDEPLQLHDAILMQLQAPTPNHVGIIVDVERMHLMHHLYGRLSERSVYGGYWSQVTVSRWRHPNKDASAIKGRYTVNVIDSQSDANRTGEVAGQARANFR